MDNANCMGRKKDLDALDYQVCWGRKWLFGEENKVVKRGMEYQGCVEEYNVEKRVLGRISKRKGDLEGWGRKSKSNKR